MLRSLRFRLPALFLLGIVLAGVVATLIAVRFFQSYTRTHAASELRAESAGIGQLYEQKAGSGTSRCRTSRSRSAATTSLLGTRRARRLAAGRPAADATAQRRAAREARGREPPAFDLHARGGSFFGVAQVVQLCRRCRRGHARRRGAGVRSSASRWLQLALGARPRLRDRDPRRGRRSSSTSRSGSPGRSRRSTAAADEVAAGHYDVAVPERTGGSEVERLAARFDEMTARLAESEQLSRNFLMSVSHELRTPLTAIRGHVAALREGVLDDEVSQRRSLEVVSEEALRLERLVGDVLDLAKLDARRFALLREEVDMRALCERAYATFAEEARARGIEYDLELGEGAVLVTDGDRVLQIVTNLIANALHWTPEGGRVDLGLATAERRGDGRRSGHRAGIAPQERERIFRPFWSGDGGGTGLGLTIARELALALGGRLELDSEPGRGSRFVLVLPVQVSLAGGLTLAEAVDDGVIARQAALELRQALFDAPPARRDEVDEQREVVDARVPLGEDVSLDPLEPADHLVRQPRTSAR